MERLGVKVVDPQRSPTPTKHPLRVTRVSSHPSESSTSPDPSLPPALFLPRRQTSPLDRTHLTWCNSSIGVTVSEGTSPLRRTQVLWVFVRATFLPVSATKSEGWGVVVRHVWGNHRRTIRPSSSSTNLGLPPRFGIPSRRRADLLRGTVSAVWSLPTRP